MTLEEALRIIESQGKAIAELIAQNTTFRAEIVKLKEQLSQHSRNSDRPPSSDGFKKRQKNSKKSKRKRGAQPGHKGTNRPKAAIEEVSNHIEFHLEGACDCGCSDVVGKKMQPSHQTWELPEMGPIITQYYVESGRCKNCRKRRTASLPSEVPKGALGPRTQSIIAMLTGQYRLSRRNAEKLLKELCGLTISLGTVSNSEKIVSDALRNPCMEILKQVRASDIVNTDETGHLRFAKRLFTWGLSTPKLTVIKAGLRRNRKALMAILGRDFKGIVISDNYNAYSHLPPGRHQLCWAHFYRKFKTLSEKPDLLGLVGKTLLKLSQKVFLTRKRLKQNKLCYDDYHAELLSLKKKFEYLLGRYHLVPEIRPLAHVYLLQDQKVWLFAQDPSVEPTNNLAERDLRQPVIWRKTSFGTWSYRGDRFFERMLTFVGTLRKQGKDVLVSLEKTVKAKHSKLLPSPVFSN